MARDSTGVPNNRNSTSVLFARRGGVHALEKVSVVMNDGKVYKQN